MDGWKDRLSVGWMDGWMDGWNDGWIEVKYHSKTVIGFCGCVFQGHLEYFFPQWIHN